MPKKKLMLDLFERQLQILYSSESLILKALPHMREHVYEPRLKDIISNYIEEASDQKTRLEEIGVYLNINIYIKDGNIIRALLEDVNWLFDHFSKGLLLDVGIVSKLQAIQHFQISAYETAHLYANTLNLKDVAETLDRTLSEAYEGDEFCGSYVKGLLVNKKQ